MNVGYGQRACHRVRLRAHHPHVLEANRCCRADILVEMATDGALDVVLEGQTSRREELLSPNEMATKVQVEHWKRK